VRETQRKSSITKFLTSSHPRRLRIRSLNSGSTTYYRPLLIVHGGWGSQIPASSKRDCHFLQNLSPFHFHCISDPKDCQASKGQNSKSSRAQLPDETVELNRNYFDTSDCYYYALTREPNSDSLNSVASLLKHLNRIYP